VIVCFFLYEGEWKNDVRCGKGKVFLEKNSSRFIITGQFRNNKPVGDVILAIIEKNIIEDIYKVYCKCDFIDFRCSSSRFRKEFVV